MQQHYDVIIAGAGPAGLSCAQRLAGTGLSVLLIDHAQQIGPKACAGGLTQLAGGLDLPEGKFRSFTHQKVYLNGIPFRFCLLNPLKTITRQNLAGHQLSKISGAENIHLLHPVRLLEIHQNHITTDSGTYGFNYLVGADGSASRVRKYLDMPFKYCAGLFTEVPEISQKFTWHIYPKQLGTAYFWTFPHLAHTNVGLYFNPEYLSTAHARQLLRQHLEKTAWGAKKPEIKGGVINYHYCGCEFGNIFLAGDAAGLAIKTSGEGISAALISGSEIALKILDHAYAMPLLESLVKIKRRQEKLLAAYERHPRWHNLMYTIFLLALNSKKFQRWFGN